MKKLAEIIEAAASHPDSTNVFFITTSGGDRLVTWYKREERRYFLTDGDNVAEIKEIVEGCVEQARADLKAAQPKPTSRKVFVVMGNDYPDAVFSEEAAAEAFCKMRRAVPGSRINWRVYDFELDGKLTRNKQAVLAIIAKKKKKREVKEVVYRSISIFSRELEFFFQHEGELFYFDTVEECKAKIDELDAKAEAAQ